MLSGLLPAELAGRAAKLAGRGAKLAGRGAKLAGGGAKLAGRRPGAARSRGRPRASSELPRASRGIEIRSRYSAGPRLPGRERSSAEAAPRAKVPPPPNSLTLRKSWPGRESGVAPEGAGERVSLPRPPPAPLECVSQYAIGVVVTYSLPMRMPRIRFPDGVDLLPGRSGRLPLVFFSFFASPSVPPSPLLPLPSLLPPRSSSLLPLSSFLFAPCVPLLPQTARIQRPRRSCCAARAAVAARRGPKPRRS